MFRPPDLLLPIDNVLATLLELTERMDNTRGFQLQFVLPVLPGRVQAERILVKIFPGIASTAIGLQLQQLYVYTVEQ